MGARDLGGAAALCAARVGGRDAASARGSDASECRCRGNGHGRGSRGGGAGGGRRREDARPGWVYTFDGSMVIAEHGALRRGCVPRPPQRARAARSAYRRLPPTSQCRQRAATAQRTPSGLRARSRRAETSAASQVAMDLAGLTASSTAAGQAGGEGPHGVGSFA